VGTFNIRNTADRYSEREQLLKHTIWHDMRCELLGLQECSLHGHSQLIELADNSKEASKFFVRGSPITKYERFDSVVQIPNRTIYSGRYHDDDTYQRDGNSVLAALPTEVGEVTENKVLHLAVQRVAQVVRVQLKNGRGLLFANSHIHDDETGEIRCAEVDAIEACIVSAKKDDDVVVWVGDFNTLPTENIYKRLTGVFGYQSALAVANGREPAITFPSGIQAPFMDTGYPHGCLDYILVKGRDATVEKAQVAGDKAKEDDPTIYPSDHFALWADITIDI